MSSSKIDRSHFGDEVLELLKKQTEGVEGPVYADLSGQVFDARQYREELETNEGFALEQIRSAIQAMAPVPAQSAEGITPIEQKSIAEEVIRFADRNAARPIPAGHLLEAFLRSRPALAASVSAEDLKRVADTLEIERDLLVQVPSEATLADLRRQFFF